MLVASSRSSQGVGHRNFRVRAQAVRRPRSESSDGWAAGRLAPHGTRQVPTLRADFVKSRFEPLAGGRLRPVAALLGPPDLLPLAWQAAVARVTPPVGSVQWLFARDCQRCEVECEPWQIESASDRSLATRTRRFD